jgi:hypothetical protein
MVLRAAVKRRIYEKALEELSDTFGFHFREQPLGESIPYTILVGKSLSHSFDLRTVQMPAIQFLGEIDHYRKFLHRAVRKVAQDEIGCHLLYSVHPNTSFHFIGSMGSLNFAANCREK